MSDPFYRLLDDDVSGFVPDVAAIKRRARRVERRRYAAMGTAAVLVVVAAVGGIVFTKGDNATKSNIAAAATASPAASGGVKSAAGTVSGSAASGALGQRKGARALGGPSGAAAQSTAAQGAAPTVGQAFEAIAPSPPLEVTADATPVSLGRGEQLTLKVCNRASVTLTRSFSTTQRYDFEVKQGASHVWRWSNGKAFAQQSGSVSWGPGKCTTSTETWGATDDTGVPVAPGIYDVTGTLASSPSQQSTTKSFCVDVCQTPPATAP